MDKAHAEVAASAAADRDRLLTEQAQVWTTRLRDVLDDDPRVAEGVRTLLAELGTTASAAAPVVQHARADHASQAVTIGGGITGNTGELYIGVGKVTKRKVNIVLAPFLYLVRVARKAVIGHSSGAAAVSVVVLLAVAGVSGWRMHWPSAIFGATRTEARSAPSKDRSPGMPVWAAATQLPGVDTPSNLGRNVGLPGVDLGLEASVSCGSPGNCGAGISTGTSVAVLREQHGIWSDAKPLPGIAALNVGGDAQVSEVSCATAVSCSLGGYYSTGPKGSSSSGRDAFVADEVAGVWGQARQIPGLSGLNVGNNAQVFSVSCAGAASCAAGGYYDDASGAAQAFVADEVNGTWHTAQEVPGTASLNTGRAAEIDSVSCPDPGNCSAVGQYEDGWPATLQVFAVDEVNGSWGVAQEIPGTAALNAGGNDYMSSVSCAAPGECSAAGYYTDATKKNRAFVVDEINGSWGAAQEIPGTAVQHPGGSGNYWVSCAAPGQCSAAGSYTDAAKKNQVFVVDEINGSWGAAQQIPGITVLNSGGMATIDSVSCAGPGQCSVGGSYADGSGRQHAFVADEVDGRWRPALEVPGMAALKAGSAPEIDSVSCAAPGECSAVGDYKDGSADHRAFAVSETSPPALR
jgi:hypothetical protein